MGKLIPFQPPPGVWANGTPYQAKGRWNDSNLVRWKDGKLQPLGGWEETIGTAIEGIGRAMITWRDFTGDRWLAIGTNEKLYIFTSLSGTASDISPSGLVEGSVDASVGLGFGAGDFGGTRTRATVTGTDISFTASGSVIASSSTVFTDATATPVGPLPFNAGDEIEISGSSESANNKTYPLSHRIYSISANQMTVGPTNGSAVYGSDTLVNDAAGDSVTIKRTRRYGNENSATSSLVLEASSWIFDLWGENLLGLSTADGKIYQWDPTTTDPTGTIAAVITPSLNNTIPVNNASILVSKERILFALGANGNTKKIQWSDQEDNTTWTPTAINMAGDFEIESSGKILAGKTVGDQILVWTTTDCHTIFWVGAPYVYGRRKVGDACGAISNRSMVAVGDKAFWMSSGGFFQFQGSVQPLQCDVQDHVFKDLNRLQDSKIYASVNPEFFEATWWYASADSDEILKYVTYNYSEGWWSLGELCRTAFATGSPGVFPKPIGIADDGTIYQHEIDVSSAQRTTSQVPVTKAQVSDYERKLVTGTIATDDVGLCYAQTGAMEIGEGENITNITQLITDSTQGTNGLRFKFNTAYTPNGTESESEIYDIADDGYTDVREQGRQFKYRVESGFDQHWEIGTIRAEIAPGGRR